MKIYFAVNQGIAETLPIEELKKYYMYWDNRESAEWRKQDAKSEDGIDLVIIEREI